MKVAGCSFVLIVVVFCWFWFGVFFFNIGQKVPVPLWTYFDLG